MTEKHRSIRRQLFPEKLWELVNKPASGIQWSPDGKRIEVERSRLEKFIGTKFRSQNFDSFIRQLHFYGFRKCGNSYHHEKFQRGRPEALLTMRRKYSNFTFNQIPTADMGSERVEDIMMYLLEPNSSLNGSVVQSTSIGASDRPMQSFSKIQPSRARAVIDKNSVAISLQEVMKDPGGGFNLPMTLILNKVPVGGQTLLSAYFVYDTPKTDSADGFAFES